MGLIVTSSQGHELKFQVFPQENTSNQPDNCRILPPDHTLFIDGISSPTASSLPISAPEELNNRLPISSVVAPVVALSFMCLTLTQTGA